MDNKKVRQCHNHAMSNQFCFLVSKHFFPFSFSFFSPLRLEPRHHNDHIHTSYKYMPPYVKQSHPHPPNLTHACAYMHTYRRTDRQTHTNSPSHACAHIHLQACTLLTSTHVHMYTHKHADRQTKGQKDRKSETKQRDRHLDRQACIHTKRDKIHIDRHTQTQMGASTNVAHTHIHTYICIYVY